MNASFRPTNGHQDNHSLYQLRTPTHGDQTAASGNRHFFASIEPAIRYLGTPTVLIVALNEDGTANLAPMASAWWLG